MYLANPPPSPNPVWTLYSVGNVPLVKLEDAYLWTPEMSRSRVCLSGAAAALKSVQSVWASDQGDKAKYFGSESRTRPGVRAAIATQSKPEIYGLC
jgi:hypothetical protein